MDFLSNRVVLLSLLSQVLLLRILRLGLKGSTTLSNGLNQFVSFQSLCLQLLDLVLSQRLRGIGVDEITVVVCIVLIFNYKQINQEFIIEILSASSTTSSGSSVG